MRFPEGRLPMKSQVQAERAGRGGASKIWGRVQPGLGHQSAPPPTTPLSTSEVHSLATYGGRWGWVESPRLVVRPRGWVINGRRWFTVDQHPVREFCRCPSWRVRRSHYQTIAGRWIDSHLILLGQHTVPNKQPLGGCFFLWESHHGRFTVNASLNLVEDKFNFVTIKCAFPPECFFWRAEGWKHRPSPTAEEQSPPGQHASLVVHFHFMPICNEPACPTTPPSLFWHARRLRPAT